MGLSGNLPQSDAMELTELLGSSFDCACGKQHTVPTEEFIYGEDSFELIPRLINTYSTQKRCLIIADTRTYGVAGREIEGICETGGVRCDHLIVADAGGDNGRVSGHDCGGRFAGIRRRLIFHRERHFPRLIFRLGPSWWTLLSTSRRTGTWNGCD